MAIEYFIESIFFVRASPFDLSYRCKGPLALKSITLSKKRGIYRGGNGALLWCAKCERLVAQSFVHSLR